MTANEEDIWEQLRALDLALIDTSRPQPEDRKTKRVLIRALLDLHDQLKGVRALARR